MFANDPKLAYYYQPTDGPATAVVEHLEGIHGIAVGIDVLHDDGDEICLDGDFGLINKFIGGRTCFARMEPG